MISYLHFHVFVTVSHTSLSSVPIVPAVFPAETSLGIPSALARKVDGVVGVPSSSTGCPSLIAAASIRSSGLSVLTGETGAVAAVTAIVMVPCWQIFLTAISMALQVFEWVWMKKVSRCNKHGAKVCGGYEVRLNDLVDRPRASLQQRLAFPMIGLSALMLVADLLLVYQVAGRGFRLCFALFPMVI